MAKKMKLWQDAEGKWCCSHPEMGNKSWSTGDTPNEAVERSNISLADFRQMVAHFDGTCPGTPETCRWCKEHPNVFGIRKPRMKKGRPASSRAS